MGADIVPTQQENTVLPQKVDIEGAIREMLKGS